MRKAEVAAAASLLLAVAVIAYFLVGPIYQTAGGSCSSDGPCVTYSGGTGSLSWNSVLLVPVVASGLVLIGVVLNRWTTLSLPMTGIGCLGLAVITFLGVFSIGMFLLPADVAAGLALLYIWQRPRRG